MSSPCEIYVHIPFCVRKCAYCDFLSFPGSKEMHRAYLKALKEEIKAVSEEGAFTLRSVFFGGGTPSLMPADELSALLQLIRSSFVLLPDAEITLETNPGTFDAEKARIWREAGFNRVSLGIQSFDNALLKRLGRIHSSEEAIAQFHLLRECGFENINIDLMMGLPDQSLRQWRETLNTALSLQPEHLSCYSLIVEPGTPFFEENRNGLLDLPSEECEREMYRLTRELLGEAGFHQYEISNFAREGYESLHNLGYWERVPYFGFGLGASSFVRRENQEFRYRNTDSFTEYLNSCNNPALFRVDQEILSRKEAMEEFMFLGLRKTKGISENSFEQAFGQNIDEVFGPVIASLKQQELLTEEGGYLFLSERGTDLGNRVFASFLLD